MTGVELEYRRAQNLGTISRISSTEARAVAAKIKSLRPNDRSDRAHWLGLARWLRARGK